jgi:hypothetical protein
MLQIKYIYAIGLDLGPIITRSVVAYAGQYKRAVSLTQQRSPAKAVSSVKDELVPRVVKDERIRAASGRKYLGDVL